MTLLALTNVTVRRGPRRVLDSVSLQVAGGEFVGLIGPNGSGKTTLLRAALGLLPYGGQSSLADLPARARARAAAFLPQAREIAWPVTVERLVALGRLPLRAGAQADARAIDAALAALDLVAFRERPVTGLSGGEQARALLARALAQETPLLLADEPTASLDPAASLHAMETLAGRVQAGAAVLAALHDLGLAARFCTRLVLLQAGRVIADGPPRAVLTSELMAAAFGIRAWFVETPDGPVFQPLAALR